MLSKDTLLKLQLLILFTILIRSLIVIIHYRLNYEEIVIEMLELNSANRKTANKTVKPELANKKEEAVPVSWIATPDTQEDASAGKLKAH